MKKIKWIMHFIFVTIIVICIELFVFNFNFFSFQLNKNIEKNIELTLNEAALVNWIKVNNEYISEPDPMIIYEDINVYVKSIKLYVKTKLAVNDITLFYTHDNVKEFNADNMKVINTSQDNNMYIIKINENIRDLRIDLGDVADTELLEFDLIINPSELNFSIERCIMMICIYYGALGLFSLQKTQNYQLQ